MKKKDSNLLLWDAVTTVEEGAVHSVGLRRVLDESVENDLRNKHHQGFYDYTCDYCYSYNYNNNYYYYYYYYHSHYYNQYSYDCCYGYDYYCYGYYYGYWDGSCC